MRGENDLLYMTMSEFVFFMGMTSYIINVLTYDINETIKKPEFLIMSSVSLIWLLVYSYILNKISKK